MKSKHFAVVGILAAAAMGLTGCGQEGAEQQPQQELGDTRTSEPMGTTDDTTTRERDMVGQGTTDESMYDQSESAIGGAVDRGRDSADQGIADAREGMGMGTQTETTEFAALDTDASGDIDESEWEQDAVQGADFSQFDEDGDGQVDRDEFRQGMQDQQMTQSGMSDQDNVNINMPSENNNP